jgi:hypothetical protein
MSSIRAPFLSCGSCCAGKLLSAAGRDRAVVVESSGLFLVREVSTAQRKPAPRVKLMRPLELALYELTRGLT